MNLIPSTPYKLTVMAESKLGTLGLPTVYLITTAADPPSNFSVVTKTHEVGILMNYHHDFMDNGGDQVT